MLALYDSALERVTTDLVEDLAGREAARGSSGGEAAWITKFVGPFLDFRARR